MEKKCKKVPGQQESESESGDCCGSCGDRSCGSCGGECHAGNAVDPRSNLERLGGGWSILGVLTGMLLIVWIVAKGVEVRQMLSYPPAGTQAHTLVLSATGKAVVSPDIAEIELSVVSEGIVPLEVQKQNTQKMNAIIEFVKSNGIDQKDIKTATYSLYPKYEYDKGQSTIVGYALTQSLRVKLRDVTKIGPLLEGAAQHGANQVGDVRFLVDDPDMFRAEARQEAFEKVRIKAGALAQYAGIILGRIITFSESSTDVSPPVFYGKAEFAGAGGAPQVEPGTQDITVTVTVTYEIL